MSPLSFSLSLSTFCLYTIFFIFSYNNEIKSCERFLFSRRRIFLSTRYYNDCLIFRHRKISSFVVGRKIVHKNMINRYCISSLKTRHFFIFLICTGIFFLICTRFALWLLNRCLQCVNFFLIFFTHNLLLIFFCS